MKNYLIILIILTIVGYINTESKENYKYPLDEEHGLYVEVCKSGLTGNITTQYLTDSTSFRVCLGTFNEQKSFIRSKLHGDKIDIEKGERIATSSQQQIMKVVERKTYSLKDLKSKHNFKI